MKVLLVIDSLCAGGAQRQMSNLAKGLKKSGHDVCLFHYYPNLDHFRGSLQQAEVTIIDGVKRSRFSLLPVIDLARLFNSARPDLVVSFLDTPNVYTLLASFLRRPPALVVSERFAFFAETRSVLARIRYWLYRRATTITVNSYHHGKALCSRFPVLTKKVRVIYNGIDLQEFSPSAEFVRGPTLRLLSVGSLLPEKNAAVLIDALSIVRKSGLDVVVTWLGRVDQSAKIRAEYAARTEQLNERSLSPWWTWGGEVADVAAFINASDAVVHPALIEGLPNAVCESMACGKPVLASDIGDHRRLLGTQDRGLLFDASSAESVAAAIVDFARLSQEQRNQMGRNGRDYAESKLGLNRYVDEYAALSRCV